MNEIGFNKNRRAILYEQLVYSKSLEHIVEVKDPFINRERNSPNAIYIHNFKQKILLISGLIISLHYVIWLIADHFPTEPLSEKKPEPVVVEIIKPKEELPKIIEPKPEPVKVPPMVQKSKPSPTVEKVQPLKKIADQPKPIPNTVEQPIAKTVQQTESPNSAAVSPSPEKLQQPAPAETSKQENQPITDAKGYAGYLSNPAPEYPEVALDRGWEGSVILRVKVSPTGSPVSVEIKTGSGKKVLDDAAIRTVKRWKFSPALRGSTPIEGWVDVPIRFKLPN